ncbi:MAG: hypothetical protein LBD42_04685 [Desulfovibrio sp.]|jgi:hypothetical protein|nr:hypothetical protein [Desulfovibrio sp.]
MRSTAHLFNTALARLGGEQLSVNISPLEQDSLGQLCLNLFPHVLDMTLAVYAWAFATRRVALAAPVLEAVSINPEYPHAFELPADCVKPLRLEGYAGVNRAPPYVIEGRSIRCALPHAVFVYVSRVTDPAMWPPFFADALAWALAGELAAAKNNDPQKQQWCYQNHRYAVADAVALEQRDQNPRRKRSEWTAARLGEGDY